MSHPRAALLVLVGGSVGTLARYGIGEWLGPSDGWPWATFSVNVIGSLLLGVLVARVVRSDDRWRLLLGTGVMGGFTTYSAFAVETDTFLRDDRLALALSYPAVTVLLGVAAALTGMTLARREPT